VPSVEEKVRQIIMDQLGLEASEVKLHTSFEDDLGADSRDLMEVVMRLEESFALESRMGKRKRSGLCRTRWITFRGMQSRFSSDSGLG